ncbi:hypothetical protein Q5X61_10635 [Acinetobacter baumannii]|nr:hypothetical protein [Acinetobacter baumannii]
MTQQTLAHLTASATHCFVPVLPVSPDPSVLPAESVLCSAPLSE